MHRHGHAVTTGEGSEQEEEWWPRLSRWEPYEEALWAASQMVLDTAKALQGDIKKQRLITNLQQKPQQKSL